MSLAQQRTVELESAVAVLKDEVKKLRAEMDEVMNRMDLEWMSDWPGGELYIGHYKGVGDD